MTQAAGTHHAESQPAIDRDLFCQTCGYNLRGLTSKRCPECGSAFEHIRGGDPQIPWMYRRRLGWFRAYRQTVWFVMFRQRRFVQEMARPVSFRESQSFRWMTVTLALVPLALGATPGVVFLRGGGSGWWGTVVAFPTAIAVGLSLVLAGVTGVPSYFFHPRSVSILQQNRAIALSYYACGPLSLLGIPVVLYWVGNWIGFDRSLGGVLILLGITLPLGLLAAWWLDLIHLSLRLLPQRPGRAVGIAVLVPLLWCLVTCGCFILVPTLVLSAIILFRSLL